ncbi:Holliday junction branch migration protein RuvA [Clostridium sp. MD294]|uniref:Holliday junction branch migration protein RuvA n=1 Tax=Clostridium sp. MD294 TaxID=97138 RepID=UPI0002C99B44|nr:Holliday junction branch migration protein RuvA [Clostridium sp. MD294]NDO46889.1 Holliday junction branch migration protein RuvA [Clostridium sp. MD294]USF28668.1 Holliday junction ATP-dependent DNA helicase RuvA [Clostridium sp. MD294]
MISYIKGIITYKSNSFVVIECNGIGYKIFVSSATLSHLNEKETIMIYTFMNVKEDDISLFGFLTQQEQTIFHQLLSVSGIGPKGALAFLSEMTPEEIIIAILSEDIKTLSKAPGIGKKTAQRLILELKDKVKSEEITQQTSQKDTSQKWEAIEALTSLGYSRSEAMQAVNACYKEGLSVEEILKLSFKKLIKF